MASRRGFGRIRQFRSGRWQASYTGPDAQVHLAPDTFQAKLDAEAWLTDRRREIDRDVWSPAPAGPRRSAVTVTQFADLWLRDRPLKPRSREHYGRLLETQILPVLGELSLTAVTPAVVRSWHASTAVTTPTMRAHAYSLLRSILATAVSDELIAANPCSIRGAGNAKRVHKIRPVTLVELQALVEAMPGRFRVMTLLAAWCGLRYGEITELRRKDIDLRDGVLHIRRAVVRVGGAFVVGTPKSDAGVRDVAVPPHLLPAVRAHLDEYVDCGPDVLMFPGQHGGHLAPSALYRHFYVARVSAGRPDLRWHDLRHTGAVLAASTGATLAELMARLGHSTPAAALRYQHAAEGRDQAIARALSDLVLPGSTLRSS
jgi:integrase